MKRPFVLRMARRESRSTRRRLLLYTTAIALGVGSLVAINAFRTNVDRAVSAQARTLLGADLELFSRWAYPDELEGLLDSLVAEDVALSRVTRFGSMALAPRTGLTRLVQVRAVEGGFPYYGTIRTDPPGLWVRFRAGRNALVDPALLIQLDLAVGDSLAIGETRFAIAGTVTDVPGDIGLRSALGPRVYIPARHLEATGLLRYGSLASYRTYLRFEQPNVIAAFLGRYEDLFERSRVGYDTVQETEEELSWALDRLARFLGLVGLAALLLGGVGVASGVHVFVTEKLDTAAVLRCLGARQRQVFAVYLAQATLIGLVGATAGVAIGLLAQAALPAVVRDFLPLEVPFRLEPAAIGSGLLIGVWISLLFALLPLLRIRNVAPLRALRRDFERTAARRDPWRYGTYAGLGGTLVLLTLWQAPDLHTGLGFAAALAATLLVLWAMAAALMWVTRRHVPRRARYALRQGVANLFRPQNQTIAVTLALGFGVFLISTLYVVQRNLIVQIGDRGRSETPNLVIFDVQPDQADGALEILGEHGAPVLQRTPIVPARIVALNDRTVEEVLADTSGPPVARWALRREYRHTYRDRLVGSERLVDGEWFDRRPAADGLPRISIEEGIAEDLHVGIGDRITWDVAGVRVESEIVNIRSVEWARFEPNFFVVFEPGVLDDAPRSLVILTRVDDASRRAAIQRDLVRRYPNLSALDLTTLIEAIDSVLDRVALAIRFMALFSIGGGLVILVGTIATSRFQRVRESVLLKTLGARSGTIGRILATEYFALGALAGLAGAALAGLGGWALIRFTFDMDYDLPVVPLAAFWLGTAVLTTVIGLASSRDVVRRTPLEGMRELAE